MLLSSCDRFERDHVYNTSINEDVMTGTSISAAVFENTYYR